MDTAQIKKSVFEPCTPLVRQALLLAPRLEQVFERLSHNGFALAAADFFDDVKLLEVVVD